MASEDEKGYVPSKEEIEETRAPPPVKALDSEDFSEEEDLKKDSNYKATETTNDDIKDYPMREFSFQFPLGHYNVSFNPLTSFLGIAVLWGISIWCMLSPDDALIALKNAKSQTTYFFTWFFIVSRPLFIFFVLYVAYKYGHIKLGLQDSTPEFSNVTYFAMLFSAGLSVGLFFFGVSEPLWYQTDTYIANQDYRTQDEIDQNAINQTLYQWGFAAWGGYIVVAIAQGLGTYRFGLPMTFRSSFYPLLGEYTWGFWGDIIDSFTIVTTVAGICTSLGLGAFQIAAGMQRLGWLDEDLTEEEETRAQVVIVWFITLIGTASVISGLNIGIKYLSLVGFSLGVMLLFLCLALERTNYIFNLIVQSVGFYLQWSIFQLGFHTDAFGQLTEGEGRAVDGQAAPVWFQDAWTVFYMAWWMAWSAFVGMFIARISKGRTIGQITIVSFAGPVIYNVLWFCTFGGIGLRQARQALELSILGETYYNDSGHFLASDSTYCYDVPQDDVYNGTNVIFTNSLVGITPVCEFNPAESDQAWFNVMFSYSFPNDNMEGFGSFLAILSLIALVIYFVTSSDSGSLVVDQLASNGLLHHHWIQRLFWAFTEGAVATALLSAGGSDALSALQAASIVFGLPFTVLVLYMCQSIICMCEQLDANSDSTNAIQEFVVSKGFSMSIFGGVFNVIEYAVSFGNVHEERVKRGMDLPTSFQTTQFFVALFLPFVSLRNALKCVNVKNSSKKLVLFTTALYALTFVAMITFFVLASKSAVFVVLGWACFFINGCILTSVRNNVREKLNLSGNALEDFLASSFFYPQVLVQILVEYQEGGSGVGNSREEFDL